MDIPVEEAVCNDPERCSHRTLIQECYDDLESAMKKASKRSIPK